MHTARSLFPDGGLTKNAHDLIEHSFALRGPLARLERASASGSGGTVRERERARERERERAREKERERERERESARARKNFTRKLCPWV